MAGLAALLATASLSPSSAPAHAEEVQRAPAPTSPACPAQGTSEANWEGMSLLRGGKGYAETPMGQVHCPRAGPRGGLTLVLLHQTPWSLSEDGRHLSDYYQYIRDYAGPHPRTRVTANWSTIHWNLAADSDVAHEAVFRHDLASDLDRVEAPVLILSDAGDSLRANDLRASSLHPAFRFRTLSEGRAHALMIDPALRARVAAEFVAGIEENPAD